MLESIPAFISGNIFYRVEVNRMENTGRDCCICGSQDSLFLLQKKWICEKCIQMAIEKRNFPWKDSIENLIKEYNETCDKCLSSNDPEDIHRVRVLGRKIRSVLQFIGLPKKHALILPIRKVHLILNKIREVDVLLNEIKSQDQENKLNSEMVKILSQKQKEMKERLKEDLPILINDSFYNKVKRFANEKLISYVVSLEKEKILEQYEENFNQLVEEYYQTADQNGKTSANTIKLLHNVRKKAKSLRYIYDYVDEVFDLNYSDTEGYYKEIQRQLGEIKDLEDWLKLMKAFENMLNVPKREIKEVRKNLKQRLKHLVENVELRPVSVE